MVRRSYSRFFLISFVASLSFPAWNSALPQTPQASPSGTSAVAGRNVSHGIYLVFPFENGGASSRLDWLSEGLEELTIQSLSSAGEQVYSHAGRLGELERYGIPATAKVSRATMLHVAEDLDADFVVFGSYNSDGKNLTIECHLLRVDPPSLLTPLRENGSLDSLMELHTRLTWRLLSENDHAYPLNLAEFSKTQQPLRLDAFEHYIRGLVTNDDEARLRELHEAARLQPEWVEPDFALGETYFTRRDCASALPWYAHVPKTHDRYVESLFSIGVCRLLMNQPDQAEESFSALQLLLRSKVSPGVDFPEVLNDLAIAKARQNKFPSAQEDLKRASSLDPDEDDYPFNLGLIAVQQGDFNGAVTLFREASHREPDIPEDRGMLIAALEKAGKKEEAEQERNSASEAFGPNGVAVVHLDSKSDAITHFERVTTEIDPETLRFEMESAEARAANSGESEARDTPAAHLRRARQELTAGRLDAAEREYRAALTGGNGNAAAHLGLAEVARREGKLDVAVSELQASLQDRDSAVVRTTLARIFLEQKKFAFARAEVERALKLAPNYAEAKQLLEHLTNSPNAPTAKSVEGSPKGGPQ
jgi:predicted Zn-dependent protease/TolB-like protein